MKILLIGGSGLLGTELLKLNAEINAPAHQQLNICDENQLANFLSKDFIPDVIINCAAVTDNREIEKNPHGAVAVNIIGAANVSWMANECGARLVYISTDYIYEGTRGNYKESDEIKPFNVYAWTKLGGECSVITVKNHLIIRTSFGKSAFDYPHAFSDKWTSKDYVDVVAPLILEAALSPLTGVLNLGTDRKTLFDHASERNENVLPISLSESNHNTPCDTSLNLQKWLNYKAQKSIAKPHTHCRVCGSEKLVKYLDLGLMPLANNLEFTSQRAREKERFPLQLMFCEDCYLSQLSVVIDPEKMFSHYTYRSSINGGYKIHCHEMAIDLRKKFGLNEESFHIDIAGNDGTLLSQFKQEIGLRVLNIDPATNLVAIAESAGVESIADFFGMNLSGSVVEKYGQADLITATNVFAHIDNVKDFILGAKILLKPNGVLVLEFPYLIDFIEGFEFDTIYFEHLSYFSVLPLDYLCTNNGMKIIDIQKQKIHGGTIRVTISHKSSAHNPTENVYLFKKNELESGCNSLAYYSGWGKSVKGVISDFANKILDLKKSGKKISAFAASAKGNTLLNSAGINTDTMDFICDETPEKINQYSPGTGIKIVNKQELIKSPPDYIVILSWNFQEEIIEKLRKIYFGKFIIAIPKFEVID